MHISPLVLNISLTINIGVIDVMPSQSERKGVKKLKNKEERKKVEEYRKTDTVDRTEQILIMLL